MKKRIVIILLLAGRCMAVTSIINAFNSGELSPQLDGRTDIAKYYAGCRTLENFLVFSYGGASRRPGTKYIATAKNSDEAARLIPFEFSTTQAYIIEVGDEYMRFYANGGQIVDSGSPVEIATPYDTDAGTDLFELHFVQSADTMYIVHPDYKPRKLTRTSNISWTLTAIDFQRGPFLPDNTTTTTISAAGYTIDAVNTTNETFGISGDGDLTSIFDDNENFLVSGSTGNDGTWTVSSTSHAAGTTTITVTGDITDATADGNAVVEEGAVTLTASAALFDTTNHVGALWQLIHTVAGESVAGSFSNSGSEQNSDSLTIQLNRLYTFTTHGTWAGDLKLQRSFDGGATWKDKLPVHYESDGNRQFSPVEGEDVDDAIYRIHADAGAAGIDSGTVNFNLTAFSFDVRGVVDITAVGSTTSATATVKNILGATDAVTTWAEGAWSPDEGWPQTVAFYEERIVYAATANNPQTVWMSVSDDWDNFLAGALDDASLSYTLAADQVNVIRWMSPQSWLLIGTIGGEWKMGSGNNEEPITPTQRVVKRQSTYGSAYLQPTPVNTAILYAQRQGRKVRELTFSFDVDGWVSPDLTVLSEHITDSGIVQMAFQRAPDPILWTVLADGDIAAMTYQRSQEVVAWHRQVTNGDFESVAVIPGSGEDEIWVSVERTVNSSTVRYIEQFQPRDFGDDQDDIFFVDSGLSFDGGAAVTITGITQAIPAVVTAALHGFSDGEQVRIVDVEGMTEINDTVYTVDDSAANTFSLDDLLDTDIDSTGFTAYTSGGTAQQVENNFTTLSHLEAETVDIAAGGAFYGTSTVSSGTVTLTDFFNTVHIGLNYVSKLQPMKLEIPGNTISGRTKRITDITVRFFETLQCKYGPTEDSILDTFSFVDEDLDTLEATQTLFTGDRKQEFDGDYETRGDIYLQADEPVPCAILSILPEFEVYR